jgi:hypothetical protein
VQWVSARLLVDLWRITFGADARSSFGGVKRFGLWESSTGLYFFDPMLEGDHEFYSGLSSLPNQRRFFPTCATREEFRIAAKLISPSARVLDVGCGFGSFRAFVPDADYTGVDPHLRADSCLDERLRAETLTEHLAERAGYYDAVC